MGERLQDVVSEALHVIGRTLDDVESRQAKLEAQIRDLASKIADGHDTTHGLLRCLTEQIETDRQSVSSFRAVSNKRLTDLEMRLIRRHDQ